MLSSKSMYKLCIIGSSDIIPKHIIAAQKNKFKLHSITSLNFNSSNAKKIKKKFKIKRFYSNWKECVQETSKIKNTCFLVAPRIEDTVKVLKFLSKYKKPIIVEKPIAHNLKKLNQIKNDKIFVGYNRIFYKTVNYIKTKYVKNNTGKIFVNVVCPEISKRNFISNSCHIISILIFLFGKLKLKIKISNKKMISCLLENKKTLINLSVIFNAPTNFKIDLYANGSFLKLSPIEELREYKKLKKIKKKNLNIYNPVLSKYIHDYDKNSKPGFNYQYKLFKKFCNNHKITIQNSLPFAKYVMSLCEKIVK